MEPEPEPEHDRDHEPTKGWRSYNQHTGEVESGLYERPFIVRTNSPGREESTVAAFATAAATREWLDRCGPSYEAGGEKLHVENWNEDGYPTVSV